MVPCLCLNGKSCDRCVYILHSVRRVGVEIMVVPIRNNRISTNEERQSRNMSFLIRLFCKLVVRSLQQAFSNIAEDVGSKQRVHDNV